MSALLRPWRNHPLSHPANTIYGLAVYGPMVARPSEEPGSLHFPFPSDHMTEKGPILRAEAPVKESFREVCADAYYCALRMRQQHISCTNLNVFINTVLNGESHLRS